MCAAYATRYKPVKPQYRYIKDCQEAGGTDESNQYRKVRACSDIINRFSTVITTSQIYKTTLVVCFIIKVLFHF